MDKEKILIVSEVFYPEEFKINELALSWKEMGYDIEVLTMVPSYPASEIYSGYKNKLFQKYIWNGINIYMVKTITGYKNSLLRKLFKYVMFMFLGSIVSLKMGKKYDYIFGFNAGPLTAMVPAIILNRFYKKPVTLWVQDIWPDSVYAYGFKKNKVIEYCLDRFVEYVYRYTSNFAISSKGFKKRILRYLEFEKEILYAPNWSDLLNKELPKFKFGDDRKTYFTFAGNIGSVQNLDNIIEAFAGLEDKYLSMAQLNIIGDGSYLQKLIDKAKNKSISSIVFFGKKPREEIYKYLEASDFLIVSLINKEIFSLTVPSKTQTYIAANKPIIGIINGETADIIRSNNLGLIAQPDDISQIKTIFEMAIKQSEDERKEYIENSIYVTNCLFNKNIVTTDLLKLLLK